MGLSEGALRDGVGATVGRGGEWRVETAMASWVEAAEVWAEARAEADGEELHAVECCVRRKKRIG